MDIGVPRETKILEGRVGLIPEACADLVKLGHRVFIEQGAGILSGYSDEQYRQRGAEIAADAESLYKSAQLLVKVKEPQPQEYPLLRQDQRLFCYLHLAANVDLARKLQEIGLTAIAFETVERGDGLPLLAPMSNIAGRLASQIGANLLHQPQGGRGVLLGGLPAAQRGDVVVIGGGVAGANATAVATALGAQVTVFDKKWERLEYLRGFGDNVTALYPYADAVSYAVQHADLLIGAVLIPGAKAPSVVSAELVKSMKKGSVIVDISVDQGGCIETTRATHYAEPTYVWEDVVHFAVTNMPGAVPRTASQSLSAALIPYVTRLAEQDWKQDEGLRSGVNVEAGEITHTVVAQALA